MGITQNSTNRNGCRCTSAVIPNTNTAVLTSAIAPAPSRCPHCQGSVTTQASLPSVDHWQEDIIENVYRVVCDRHEAACCGDCGRWVEQAGKDESLRSRIGPYVRSQAVWLRNVIGISYRRPTHSRRCPPQIIEEMHGITFTPAALIGFETMLAERALRPLVVLGKITFGSRSDAGATRMAKIMTVGETARRHGHRARTIYFELYTRPPTRVLQHLYAGA